MSTVCVVTETFCEYDGVEQTNRVSNVIGVAGNPTIAENLILNRIEELKKDWNGELVTINELPEKNGWIIDFKYSGLIDTYILSIKDFEIMES